MCLLGLPARCIEELLLEEANLLLEPLDLGASLLSQTLKVLLPALQLLDVEQIVFDGELESVNLIGLL